MKLSEREIEIKYFGTLSLKKDWAGILIFVGMLAFIGYTYTI